MKVIQRMKAPTPKFFQVMRNIGLGLIAVGGVLVSSTIALPVIAITIGQYLIVAGSVASAVAQTAVADEEAIN
jgi:hypothetical protein